MIRLGLQLVSVYALCQTSWTGIFQGEEFGNGGIYRRLWQKLFSPYLIVLIHLKREASSNVVVGDFVKYLLWYLVKYLLWWRLSCPTVCISLAAWIRLVQWQPLEMIKGFFLLGCSISKALCNLCKRHPAEGYATSGGLYHMCPVFLSD